MLHCESLVQHQDSDVFTQCRVVSAALVPAPAHLQAAVTAAHDSSSSSYSSNSSYSSSSSSKSGELDPTQVSHLPHKTRL
jgi:hypothetical protein